MKLLQLIDDKFAEQRELLGREYRESEARFLNTLRAKFDAMNTEIHNLTKRVRELETEAKEVNTLKQQVCELDAQLAAVGRASVGSCAERTSGSNRSHGLWTRSGEFQRAVCKREITVPGGPI